VISSDNFESLSSSKFELELKTLPSKAKHVLLGLEESFPKIILSEFDSFKEGRSFEDLKRNKNAKGWTFKNDKDKLIPTRDTIGWNKHMIIGI